MHRKLWKVQDSIKTSRCLYCTFSLVMTCSKKKKIKRKWLNNKHIQASQNVTVSARLEENTLKKRSCPCGFHADTLPQIGLLQHLRSYQCLTWQDLCLLSFWEDFFFLSMWFSRLGAEKATSCKCGFSSFPHVNSVIAMRSSGVLTSTLIQAHFSSLMHSNFNFFILYFWQSIPSLSKSIRISIYKIKRVSKTRCVWECFHVLSSWDLIWLRTARKRQAHRGTYKRTVVGTAMYALLEPTYYETSRTWTCLLCEKQEKFN